MAIYYRGKWNHCAMHACTSARVQEVQRAAKPTLYRMRNQPKACSQKVRMEVFEFLRRGKLECNNFECLLRRFTGSPHIVSKNRKGKDLPQTHDYHPPPHRKKHRAWTPKVTSSSMGVTLFASWPLRRRSLAYFCGTPRFQSHVGFPTWRFGSQVARR